MARVGQKGYGHGRVVKAVDYSSLWLIYRATEGMEKAKVQDRLIQQYGKC